jgi:dynein heavy chain 1
MKKTAQKPLVMDVVATAGLQKNLERLADLLTKIQKALAEYLETQRAAFARFYFVGDEDLLEIIGNSRDVTNVQRHFNKMFAGITSLTNEQNGDVITGMNSREGESVKFDVSVKISDDPKINIWLTKVQDQMRLSLAKNLESAVKEISLLSESNEEGKTEKLLHEIEVYAAQVVLLSMQVVWSNKVEKGLGASPGMQEVVDYTLTNLSILAERVLVDLKKDIRQKYEQLITEFVH